MRGPLAACAGVACRKAGIGARRTRLSFAGCMARTQALLRSPRLSGAGDGFSLVAFSGWRGALAVGSGLGSSGRCGACGLLGAGRAGLAGVGGVASGVGGAMRCGGGLSRISKGGSAGAKKSADGFSA